MDALTRWADLLQRPEELVPLDEAALLISACANPVLDVEAQMYRLDAVAGLVQQPDTTALCHVLFQKLGLRGDAEGYDDPDNSYLDQVLDRRRGIPISLSVLLIEVGRRCGVRLEAVGMPGHFLVRNPAAPDELIDPFGRGRRLDRAACERLLRSLAGPGTRLTAEMLDTTGTHAILARMLANLDRSFERRQDHHALGWVSDLRLHLPGASMGDRLHLATRLASLGRFDAAATLLEAAAGKIAEPDRERILAEAVGLRARLN